MEIIGIISKICTVIILIMIGNEIKMHGFSGLAVWKMRTKIWLVKSQNRHIVLIKVANKLSFSGKILDHDYYEVLLGNN